jgi:uncharacterized protein (DUF1684 family)
MRCYSNILLVLVIAMVAACDLAGRDVNPARFEAEHMEWRAARLESLRGPDGYLNLAGLFWLADGTISIGSASDSDIVFPASAPPHIGELQVSAAGVVLRVLDGVDVRSAGQPVRTVPVADDTTTAPVTISHGAIAWTIIRRDERFALRLRDFEHPAIAAFPPLEYYPLNPDLRVRGRLIRYAAPKVLNVDTVIEGLGWRPESPGIVEFEIDGQSLQLEAYDSGDRLFYVFGDRTSGTETYPAGRFLYSDMPIKGDETILDFNRAYNPPCAFNDFATCPVASPQNRLSVRIEAGERFDPLVHSTPNSTH